MIKPLYIALSYVWGDAADTVNLTISNVVKPVPSNLANALRHLRQALLLKQASQSCVWADAVCTYSYRSRINCRRNLRCLFRCLKEPIKIGIFFRITENVLSES